ncbi:prolipoprotein diacylglyceryl transferase, partial [Candidatus Bipolaricaulota bacterium]|nr:prolipoprotein diacylglyceryl transferase [Candidatus Bipolaricaulota bacterium]
MVRGRNRVSGRRASGCCSYSGGLTVNPIALRVGSLSIRWYGIAYAVALLAALALVKVEVARKGLDLDLNDLIDFVLISF